MQFSCFPVLSGSAEAQVIWGGIVKRFIAYFIRSISAKKYWNPFTCVKVIASQRWDVLRHGIGTAVGLLCEFVCLHNCRTKWPLTSTLGAMVHRDPVTVTFLGQGYRSKFKVTWWKCSFFDWKWKSETRKKTYSVNWEEKRTWIGNWNK